MIAMLSLVIVAIAGAAQHGASEPVQWDFEKAHRYAIEAKLQLPEVMWLGTRFNRQARLDVMDLRMVLQCEPGIRESRRSWEVHCRIDDMAFSAEALPQEAGLVQEIVEEIDDRLTGAVVEMQVKDSGRIRNVGLTNLKRRNRRFGVINDSLRLLVSRVVAGLDLPLPRNGADDAWAQNSSWIMQTPNRYGSYGTSEIVHKVTAVSPSTITVSSAGRGLIVPDEGLNKYTARLVSQTVFSPSEGRILDRTWTLVGGPTASSLIAQGTEGYPYIVEGRLVALSPGQTWNVGESVELERTRSGVSAIQQQSPPLPAF